LNADELTHVSTGTLPTLDEVRALIASAYERFREESDGNVADYIPALAEVDPALFAICVASTRGDFLAAGEADHLFSIQSVSKPFVVLAVMATAGLYERSGDWLYDVGLPGKSGVSGDILTVAPGKGALATFSPRLDEFGNSVRGQLATRFLSERPGLNLFTSAPTTPAPQ